mgnify:CR=1 FL=1
MKNAKRSNKAADTTNRIEATGNEIKEQIVNNEITKRVKDYSKNKSDLITCYNVGKLLSEAGKHYGEGIIKQYSIKLTNELGKGYTFTSLTRMRKLYFRRKDK